MAVHVRQANGQLDPVLAGTIVGVIINRTVARPTSITATITSGAGEYVLLQNGPKGGFDQFGVNANNFTGTVTVNDAVTAVISNS